MYVSGFMHDAVLVKAAVVNALIDLAPHDWSSNIDKIAMFISNICSGFCFFLIYFRNSKNVLFFIQINFYLGKKLISIPQLLRED